MDERFVWEMDEYIDSDKRFSLYVHGYNNGFVVTVYNASGSYTSSYYENYPDAFESYLFLRRTLNIIM